MEHPAIEVRKTAKLQWRYSTAEPLTSAQVTRIVEELSALYEAKTVEHNFSLEEGSNPGIGHHFVINCRAWARWSLGRAPGIVIARHIPGCTIFTLDGDKVAPLTLARSPSGNWRKVRNPGPSTSGSALAL